MIFYSKSDKQFWPKSGQLIQYAFAKEDREFREIKNERYFKRKEWDNLTQSHVEEEFLEPVG